MKPTYHHPALPSEAEMRLLWLQRVPREDIAARYGVSLGIVQSFIQTRVAAWREEIVDDLEARGDRTIDVRETDEGGVYRLLFISLPRIAMHRAAREDKGRRYRMSGKGWRHAA